ncbi:MAG: glycoside hydrolase family 3 N-terminal domain-containing protein [Desulfobulbaceae bacterium]|jgi:beta-N-acetylhexosaminidase|nr:glycoside hydrolase family 3 N-terminal domain-containing protein [Desulfobulbaceae bacterium]
MGGRRFNIGQMFLVGFDGLEADRGHPIAEAISRDRLGGVILFDRNVDGTRQNIASPEQLARLTATLQGYAEIPLLVATDQEGGGVCRLKEEDGFPPTVSARQLGDADESGETYRRAGAIASSLAQCGLNLNLAPVVDLDLNPENPIIGRYGRSFGREVERVVTQAAAFIRAHHDRGVACCLKHFPGHGSAAADSHLGFVDVTGQWGEVELAPFAGLFAAGLADAVMTAHLVNRRLDSRAYPATLSGPVINGLLRGRLGFDGVVVSDDLQMKAISSRWGFEEAVRLAVLAGVDLLLVGNNLIRETDAVTRGIKAVERLLDEKRIDVERVAASLRRIAVLKEKIAGGIAWTDSRPTTWR